MCPGAQSVSDWSVHNLRHTASAFMCETLGLKPGHRVHFQTKLNKTD